MVIELRLPVKWIRILYAVDYSGVNVITPQCMDALVADYCSITDATYTKMLSPQSVSLGAMTSYTASVYVYLSA